MSVGEDVFAAKAGSEPERKPRLFRLTPLVATLLTFAVLLLFWLAASSFGWVSKVFLPHPARVLDAVPRAKTTATALPVSSRLRRELIPDPFLPDDGES